MGFWKPSQNSKASCIYAVLVFFAMFSSSALALSDEKIILKASELFSEENGAVTYSVNMRFAAESEKANSWVVLFEFENPSAPQVPIRVIRVLARVDNEITLRSPVAIPRKRLGEGYWVNVTVYSDSTRRVTLSTKSDRLMFE